MWMPSAYSKAPSTGGQHGNIRLGNGQVVGSRPRLHRAEQDVGEGVTLLLSAEVRNE